MSPLCFALGPSLKNFCCSGSKYFLDGGAQNFEARRLWMRCQDQGAHHHAGRAAGDDGDDDGDGDDDDHGDVGGEDDDDVFLML